MKRPSGRVRTPVCALHLPLICQAVTSWPAPIASPAAFTSRPLMTQRLLRVELTDATLRRLPRTRISNAMRARPPSPAFVPLPTWPGPAIGFFRPSIAVLPAGGLMIVVELLELLLPEPGWIGTITTSREPPSSAGGALVRPCASATRSLGALYAEVDPLVFAAVTRTITLR